MKETFIKKIKAYKAALSVTLLVIGVLTAVFAILNMAGKSTKVEPDIILRYIAGIALIIIGLSSVIFNLVISNKKLLGKTLPLNALLIGGGIFLLLGEANTIMTVIVGKLFPIIITTMGGIIIIISIIYIAKKEAIAKNVWVLILGAALLGVGITFVSIDNDLTKNITWLFAALIMVAFSIYQIVEIIRDKKTNKIEKEFVDVVAIEKKEDKDKQVEDTKTDASK